MNRYGDLLDIPNNKKTDDEYEEYARLKYRKGIQDSVTPRYAGVDKLSKMWVRKEELPLKKSYGDIMEERYQIIKDMTEDEFIDWLKKENEKLYK